MNILHKTSCFLLLSSLTSIALARAPDTSVITNLPHYIEGMWCLNQEKYEDDVSYPGEIWEFKGGKYTFNGLGEDPYEIKENSIKMNNFGILKVLKISETEMVAKVYSTYYFTKDRCSNDTLKAIKLSQVNNAILLNNIDEVKRLISEGVDISKANTRSMVRMTPLMLAVREENLPIIKLLLNQNPDLKIKNSSGKSVLDYAKHSNSPEIKELINNAY